MRILKHITLLIIASNLFSCASSTHVITNSTESTYPKNSINSVLIFATDVKDRSYTVIGEVIASVDAGRDAQKSVNRLKKEAAALGADAIINLRLEFVQGYWLLGIKSTGTAIKFN